MSNLIVPPSARPQQTQIPDEPQGGVAVNIQPHGQHVIFQLVLTQILTPEQAMHTATMLVNSVDQAQAATVLPFSAVPPSPRIVG